MVYQEKKAKATALILSLLFITLSLIRIEYHAIGLYPHCPLWHHAVYHFFHANVLHALVNSLCLVSIVFLTNTKIWQLLCAYSIASAFPVSLFAPLLADKPVVGASGVCYVLFGMLAVPLKGKGVYLLWIAMLLLISFIYRESSGFYLHLFGFAGGVMVAAVSSPIIPVRDGK